MQGTAASGSKIDATALVSLPRLGMRSGQAKVLSKTPSIAERRGSMTTHNINGQEPPTSTAIPRRSWPDVLSVHPAAKLFPQMSADELRELGEDIKKHGGLPAVPLVLWEAERSAPPFLLDGRNRLDAMEAVGLPVLDTQGEWLNWNLACRCTQIRGNDPYAYVISANIHRRHLTAEQKRELIAKLIKATPEKSDRQIAETVKASPTTVGTVRAEMETKGDVSKLDTRRDSKGRKQPAFKSGRKKKTTTKSEMKALKEAAGKQKPNMTKDIVCLIAELINAHGKGMEMFVRQCLIEYAKEIARAQPNWGTEFARLVLAKLNIAAGDEMPRPSTDMPNIPDFLRRVAP